ncbi:MAG: S49 family peptidase, partial [Casimicrobiaceae bacterium]
MADDNWERGIIERLASEGLREQQRARRWSIFFRLLTFSLLFIGLIAALGSMANGEKSCSDKCTAVVDIDGELDSDSR